MELNRPIASPSYSHLSLERSSSSGINVTRLPEEVLEHIFSFLSPYKDMDAASLVCRQWHRVLGSVIHQRRRHFEQNLAACDISWTQVLRIPWNQWNEMQGTNYGAPQEKVKFGSVSERFSHSAAYHDGSMYVFGGCTSTNTTFNDLWQFDLTTRQWQRPLVMGAYPSPKACATMVVYKDNLVLFGGWSHPIPYPLHQSAHYFSELHMYNIASNRWSHVISLGQEPEALGGHSASVIGHLMVVFGGSPRPGLGTNKLWVFNFLKGTWKLQTTCRESPTPEARYGQYQATLDDKHILIMGGCVGQNRVFTDMWLLTVDPEGPWKWTKVPIAHPELAAPQTWCHAACKVGDKVVVIAKTNKPREAKNHKPRIHNTCVPDPVEAQSTSVQTSPHQSLTEVAERLSQSSSLHEMRPPQERPFRHHFAPQDSTAREAMMAQPCASRGGLRDASTGGQDTRANLLAWQKKLHRDCANLADPDNHQHHAWQAQDEAEGSFLRLQNRWANTNQADRQAHAACAEARPACNAQGQASLDQAGPSTSPNRGHQSPGHGMPSIRPNATCNRQKQLQALQRQEELVRSKSRALAAAKLAKDGAQNRPAVIPAKNGMDVFVMDISKVLKGGEAEWLPLSPLQASCAPSETICCSLLHGRGELILFGGVVRVTNSSVPTNTAINKLYLLHA